jgi:hypothetical protein
VDKIIIFFERKFKICHKFSLDDIILSHYTMCVKPPSNMLKQIPRGIAYNIPAVCGVLPAPGFAWQKPGPTEYGWSVVREWGGMTYPQHSVHAGA